MTSNLGSYGAFGTYNLDEAIKEETWSKAAGSDGKFMKLEVGRNVVRFIPPPIGRSSPFVTVFQHYIQMPGMVKPVVFNCPRLMANSICPACKKSDQLVRTGNKVDKEASRNFWASRRIYANVIDRKDPDAGPKILGFGKSVFEMLLNIRKDPEAGGDFTHPIEGFDVIITREGMGLRDTNYIVNVARQATELGNPAWIQIQPDLTSLSKVLGWEDIKKLFLPQGENAIPAISTPEIEEREKVGATVVYEDEIPF